MLRSSLITITSLAALAGAAHATAMLPLDLPTLCDRADRVVLGTVESTMSRWTDAHDAIYTDVTLRVSRAYKGATRPGETIVVRREGGSVDGIGMRVFGAAAFHVGEEALVFVERRGGASYVVGMSQGKLRVATRPDGQKMLAADLTDIHFVRPGESAFARARTLDEVEREIATHLRRGAVH
jgi:hypothetical protein